MTLQVLQHVNNVFELQSVDAIKRMSHGTTASSGSSMDSMDSDTAGKLTWYQKLKFWIVNTKRFSAPKTFNISVRICQIS